MVDLNWRSLLKHGQGVVQSGLHLVTKLLRRKCYLCDFIVLDSYSGICPICFTLLPIPQYPCIRCGTALPQPLEACGYCLSQAWPITELIAAGSYAWPLKGWILNLKHHQQLADGRLMAECLSVRLQQCGATADYLIPMPLHLDRLKERGFNQASEIARVVSRNLHIPTQWHWAVRQKATKSQADLKAIDRRQNMRNAFIATVSPGATLAIIDDVVTTGSSSIALAETLLKAGAKEVKVWCVARVQKKEDNIDQSDRYDTYKHDEASEAQS